MQQYTTSDLFKTVNLARRGDPAARTAGLAGESSSKQKDGRAPQLQEGGPVLLASPFTLAACTASEEARPAQPAAPLTNGNLRKLACREHDETIASLSAKVICSVLRLLPQSWPTQRLQQLLLR